MVGLLVLFSVVSKSTWFSSFLAGTMEDTERRKGRFLLCQQPLRGKKKKSNFTELKIKHLSKKFAQKML